MQITGLMQSNPVTLLEETTVQQAVCVFMQRGIDGAPVVDENSKIKGVFTKTHLYRLIAEDLSLQTPVGLVMQKKPVLLAPDCGMEAAWLKAQKESVELLPVVERSGSLVGVVTREQLRQAYTQNDSASMSTQLDDLRRELESKRELTEIYHSELEKLRTKNLGHTIVCESQAMRQVLDLAVRVARVDTTILILGESGVGKDVVARLIHKASGRAKAPFIRINCGAIPENLLESELFGYEAGAFTGAKREGKPGLLELAHGGTLFLDEIAELPMALQVKLLSVIQEREVTRLGGVKAIPVDMRFIAATNKNLAEQVHLGLFREDLYYRLHVVPINIPPLRERRSDIPALIIHFLRKINTKYQYHKSISAAAIEQLTNYNWPGNVRELENLIERLMVVTSHDLIDTADLPKTILQPLRQGGSHGYGSEKEAIAGLYQKWQSTRKVAKILGVHQSTVVRKMKKYNIKPTARS